MTERREMTAADLAKARDDHGPLLVIEAYCEHPGCATRQVTLHLKDYDRTFKKLAANGLVCPVCRRPLKLHWAQSFDAHEATKDYFARCSVNTQRYIRDHGRSCVPASVMADDRLPE